MKERAAIFAAFGLLCWIVLTPSPARPHSWYPSECCSGTDCREAQDGEVVPVPGGWKIVPTGEFFPHNKVRWSPDGRIHRCLRNPSDIKSETLCVFVPPLGA